MTCPTCHKPVEETAPDYPFCGERCRLIDLGDWASEKHRVPGEPTAIPTDDSDFPTT